MHNFLCVVVDLKVNPKYHEHENMKKELNKKTYHFPVIIERDENGYYLGRIPSLKSCYTQAKTLPELYKRLHEVAALCIEVERELFKDPVRQNKFIGVQELEFTR